MHIQKISVLWDTLPKEKNKLTFQQIIFLYRKSPKYKINQVLPSLTRCSSNKLERTLAEQKPFPRNIPVMMANFCFSSSWNPFIKYKICNKINMLSSIHSNLDSIESWCMNITCYCIIPISDILIFHHSINIFSIFVYFS